MVSLPELATSIRSNMSNMFRLPRDVNELADFADSSPQHSPASATQLYMMAINFMCNEYANKIEKMSETHVMISREDLDRLLTEAIGPRG